MHSPEHAEARRKQAEEKTSPRTAAAAAAAAARQRKRIADIFQLAKSLPSRFFYSFHPASSFTRLLFFSFRVISTPLLAPPSSSSPPHSAAMPALTNIDWRVELDSSCPSGTPPGLEANCASRRKEQIKKSKGTRKVAPKDSLPTTGDSRTPPSALLLELSRAAESRQLKLRCYARHQSRPPFGHVPFGPRPVTGQRERGRVSPVRSRFSHVEGDPGRGRRR